VPDSQSAYNPDVSADGRHVAYQAVRDGRTAILVRDADGRTRTVVRGAKVGGATFADPYEPGLSADGSKLVYTLATGRVDDPAGAGSQVLVRDIRSGRTTVVSTVEGGGRADGFSADPAISPDGRFVVFTSDAAGLGAHHGAAGLFVRDLAAGRTRRIPTGAGRVLDPVASRGARVVAFTAMQGDTGRVMAWTRKTGAVSLVSRGTAPADGSSDDPSISADGRRIAFASTATNLDAKKPDASRAIFVRDRAAGTTRLVSDTTAAYPKGAVKPPAVKPTPAALPKTASPVSAAGTDDVLIVDNAFVRKGERPTVTIAAGTKLTWDWRSRESHSLTVRTGPERFALPARNSAGASYSHTFDKAGTYQLVCALHAPGMRMTVVVDDDG
jgi:Tol biopolymer transport system component